ncbi:MAG: hypothetical protein H0W34_10780 [Pyrinomonadaceae bacterium]|nr:hypothetical protein [Gammaproteobacteria bacterium]MBA3572434.1 hypothetical protein [Pyrinomonadaceae bacterium]
MSELDVIKSQITYLQVWLGIMVVTDISLFGWLVTNAGVAPLRLVLGCSVAAIAITAGIFFLHRRIERHITSLREL